MKYAEIEKKIVNKLYNEGYKIHEIAEKIPTLYPSKISFILQISQNNFMSRYNKNEFIKQIIELQQKQIPPKAIARKLGISLSYCYKLIKEIKLSI